MSRDLPTSHVPVERWPFGLEAAARLVAAAAANPNERRENRDEWSPRSPTASTGSQRLNEAMYDTWVEHMAMPELGSADGLVRSYMACVCGWRSDDLLGDDTWVCSDNPGVSYANHLANHLHDAAIKALAGRTIAPNPPSRLVVCNLSHCGEPDVHAHVVPPTTQDELDAAQRVGVGWLIERNALARKVAAVEAVLAHPERYGISAEDLEVAIREALRGTNSPGAPDDTAPLTEGAP